MWWEKYKRFHWRMMRLLTRFVLWCWLILGGCGFLVAMFHPAQEDRIVTVIGFGLFAAVGGGGLWIWRYVDKLRRRLRGRDQA